jgi:hypothetical protein
VQTYNYRYSLLAPFLAAAGTKYSELKLPPSLFAALSGHESSVTTPFPFHPTYADESYRT